MNTPIEEQETIVRWYRDEDKATVYTSDTTTMTKLDKRVESSDEWQLVKERKFKDGTVADKTYECPKKLISFRAKTYVSTMSEEQKRAAAERMRSANAPIVKNQAEFPNEFVYRDF